MSKKDSSVQKLKRKLYKRGAKPKIRERRELHEFGDDEVAETWNQPEEEVVEEVAEKELTHEEKKEQLERLYEGQLEGDTEKDEFEALKRARVNKRSEKEQKKKRLISRIIKGIFVTSLVFFLFAVGLAGYYIIFDKNQVSCENVSIAISGPGATASGKKLSLDVEVLNNNPVPMRDATLEVFFPKGTRDTDYSTINLSSSYEQIGTIEMGEQVRSTIEAVLFGPEQTAHTIEAVLTYAIDDSNASFSCRQPYDITIATAPVSLSVDGLEEISSGQEVEFEVTITSNAEETVPTQRLTVDYPFGFDFISANPEPSEHNNVWDLGDILPSKEKKVTVRGIARGQGTESRTINFAVGEEDITNAEALSTVLQKVAHPLLVTEPFLDVSMQLEDQTEPDVVSKLGKSISGTLSWKNNLSDALHDLEIDVTFAGSALDPISVKGQGGFFRSVDNTITWTPQTTDEEFRHIEAGEEGNLGFNFSTKEYQKSAGIENPTVQLEVTVRARRISDDKPVPQNLQEQAKKKIRFETDLAVTPYAVHNIGPFTNTGPHPPRVNKETTYTVVWEVTNTINDTGEVRVTGVLPEYVDWLDVKSPADRAVTYNPVTRQVLWTVGNVPRGVGHETQPRKMSFQIKTTPSISQLYKTITLVNNVSVSGVDEFTKSMLKQDTQTIESDLLNDPFYNGEYGEVEL